MQDIVIRSDKLSKCYRLGVREKTHDTLVSQSINFLTTPFQNWKKLRQLTSFSDPESSDVLWALREVSFEIRRGEVVGFIGRNGAGKSTLLKILSRITEPTSGQVDIFGRVSSLLEVGTGFHPELTGRENIYLNGTILGMRRREIDRKFDEIVAFSGVEKFIDTPVKRYSSGMSVRLAFAVAAHLDPEILVIDEVLAVGDAQFQQKSIGKMQEVARGEGRTVLFVSHNMAAVENLCSKVVMLERGQVVFHGETKTGVREYLKKNLELKRADLSKIHRRGNGDVQFTNFGIRDESGQFTEYAQTGRPITFVLGYRCNRPEVTREVDVVFAVHTAVNDPLIVNYSSATGREFSMLPRQGEFTCTIPRLPLRPGRYLIYILVYVNRSEADNLLEPVGALDVEGGDYYGTGKLTYDTGSAPFLVDATWELSAPAEPARMAVR